MNGTATEQDGKRTIVAVTIALLIFDLALGALAIVVGPLDLFAGDDRVAEQPAPADQSDSEAASEQGIQAPAEAPNEPVAEAPEAPAGRRVSAPERYRVEPGDTLYDVSRELWGNEDFWPLIYLRNSPPLDHPDRLEPFKELRLGSGPLADGVLEANERQELLEGYIEAYEAYRRRGEEATDIGRNRSNEYLIQTGRILINKAHWLLYRGLVFDDGYLERYSSDIQERDRRVVQSYRERFGPPAE